MKYLLLKVGGGRFEAVGSSLHRLAVVLALPEALAIEGHHARAVLPAMLQHHQALVVGVQAQKSDSS